MSLAGGETGKMLRWGVKKMGEACCCPPVVSAPHMMVHFSEKGGFEKVGTVATTCSDTDNVTSC